MTNPKIIQHFLLALLVTSCSTKPVDHRFDVKTEQVKSGKLFALASDGKKAAAIAEEIYKKGGNWADVFVATSFAISVERPQSTGIGGGGFTLAYVASEKKTYAFDFREAAPLSLSKKYKDLLGEDGKRKNELSSRNVKGAGVPGVVAGLYQIYSKWGKLRWKDLLQPAIELAEKGYPVDSLLAASIVMNKEKLLADPSATKIFFRNNLPLKEGDLLVQSDLAQMLKLIAKKGPTEFYSGSIAKKIVKFVRSSGGYIELKDMAAYQVQEREALKWKEHQYDFVGFPFPSFGGEATQLIQSDDALKKTASPENLATEWVHALERVFEFRAKKYEIASNKPQTTQISFIDSAGNAVSSTQTINSPFGSGKMVPNTGIMLNDEMDDYFYENAEALNHPTKLARPLSSMSPTLVFEDGKVKLAIGCQGGRRLISCVNWVMINYLWQGKTLEEAMASPRIHIAYPNKTLVADVTTPESWFKDLKGYKVENPPVDCRTQSVEFDNKTGIIKSVVDPRSTGIPAAL